MLVKLALGILANRDINTVSPIVYYFEPNQDISFEKFHTTPRPHYWEGLRMDTAFYVIFSNHSNEFNPFEKYFSGQ